MSFVLIPGAGGAASFWSRVVAELTARGQRAIAVDLPGPDETAGLREYTDIVLATIDDLSKASDVDGINGVEVVAQSMGGFTAAMVCAKAPVRRLTLVNAMIPLPGETAGDWWDNTGFGPARIAAARAGGYSPEFDVDTYFLHDVSPEVRDTSLESGRPEADIGFTTPCDIQQWPDVPTRVIAGSGDRFFPLEFQRRVARDRLGLDVRTTPGGHLAALSYPCELADRLLAGD